MAKNTTTTTTPDADALPTLEHMTEALTEATTPEGLGRVVTEGLALIEQAETGTGILTFKAWQPMGQACERLARLARGTESKAKVTQGEAHAAAQGVVPNLPTKQAVGRWLRAARVSADTLTEAVDMHGTPEGPVSLNRAIDILTWCEARTETAGTTNRGTAKATKAEAEAEQARRQAEAEQAEQAKAERRTKQAKARGNTVLGLLTVKAIRDASDQQLAETIVACQDALAMRQAEAEAKAKAERQAKQAEAKQAKQAEQAEAEQAKAEAERLVAEAKAEAERLVAEAKAEAKALKAKA